MARSPNFEKVTRLTFDHDHDHDMALLGTIFYVALLLINAMAVLSEDRFLARSAYQRIIVPLILTCV